MGQINISRGQASDYPIVMRESAKTASSAMPLLERLPAVERLVAGKMTPEQIAEAEKLAQEWNPK